MITVKKNGSNLFWTVKKNVGFNTHIQVENNCVAVVLCDGEFFEVLKTGFNVVRPGHRAGLFRQASDTSTWDVVGMQKEIKFEMPWGFGGVKYNVQYSGQNIKGELAANGTLELEVFNPQNFFKAFYKEGEEITIKSVEDTLHREICNVVKNSCEEILNRHSGLDNARKAGVRLETEVKKSLEGKMFDRYGLIVKDISISINSDGLEEFYENEREILLADQNAEKKIRTAKGEKAMREAEAAGKTDDQGKKSNSTINVTINSDKEEK